MAVLIATQALFVATDVVQIAVQNAGDGAVAPGHHTFQQEHQQDRAMQQSCRLPKVSSKSGRWGPLYKPVEDVAVGLDKAGQAGLRRNPIGPSDAGDY